MSDTSSNHFITNNKYLATPKGAAPLWHDTTFFFLDLESYTHGRFHRPWISSRSRPQCGM